MQLHSLPKSVTKGKRRGGQGHGSGRVKTAGRGTKGQKARHSIPLFFEGGALPLIKRLPFLRGKGRNFSFQVKPVVVNISDLEKLPKDSVVDAKALLTHHIISVKESKQPIKILGNGKVAHALTIKLPISNQAKEKIEKAGGRVE